MRYLGNTHTNQFHDLTRTKPQCQIAVIEAKGHAESFTPDTLLQAITRGYEPCYYCLGTFADLDLGAGFPLAAAANLEGEDLGGGEVELRWTHPDDIAAHGVRFDVYSSRDPLDPFRTLRLGQHEGTTATLGGFEQGGDLYFTVVARRGGQQSLPTPILHLHVEPVRAQVVLGSSGTSAREAGGIAFPFRIDGVGRVHVEGGDPRRRSKILQLLLTSPGERVNQPEYGTRLRDLVFDPNNDVLAAATEFTVTRALRRYLGDEIHVDKVQILARDAELSVDIVYLRKSDLGTERLRVGIPILR